MEQFGVGLHLRARQISVVDKKDSENIANLLFRVKQKIPLIGTRDLVFSTLYEFRQEGNVTTKAQLCDKLEQTDL